MSNMRLATVDQRIKAAQIVRAVIAADHEGFKHSAFDWWGFDARTTSPKTCPVCKALDGRNYRGDRIPTIFPYHTHQAINVIRAKVHPNCRCRLRWLFRTEVIRLCPMGLLTPAEEWEIQQRAHMKEMKVLTPSQRKMVMPFLQKRHPWG